jgi:hypothetical protein
VSNPLCSRRQSTAGFGHIADHHDIIVSKPTLGLSITYRKQGRILEAVEPLRIDPSAEELVFLIQAWKAVCESAIARLALLTELLRP